jgi:RNA polymerase sigma factor (sigma-70 family)
MVTGANNKDETSRNRDEAFNKIVMAYYEKILAFCSYSLGGNRSIAEDCTQDIFFILYNSMPKLRDYEKIGGWLYKTAGNIIRQYAAALKRERKKIVESRDIYEMENSAGPIPGGLMYEEKPDTQEMDEEKIRSCTKIIMGRLKEGELAVWRLAFRDKQSIRSVAAALHISESAAKSRINRLRHKILDISHDIMKETD